MTTRMTVTDPTPTARGNDPVGYTVERDGTAGRIISARYGGKLDGTIEVQWQDGTIERTRLT